MRSPWSFLGLATIAIVSSSGPAWAVKPTAQELTRSCQWVAESFLPVPAIKASSPKPGRPLEDAAAAPFSFAYGGKASEELLATWEYRESANTVDNARTRRTQTYRDRTSGLGHRG